MFLIFDFIVILILIFFFFSFQEILGVAIDGYPIYGKYDENGNELTPADLDECNGHWVNGQYRYYFISIFCSDFKNHLSFFLQIYRNK
jgi:hypothetical protein